MAPRALLDTHSKIRNSVASVISSIAHWDWPEQWPNLFEILMQLLKNPEVSTINHSTDYSEQNYILYSYRYSVF